MLWQNIRRTIHAFASFSRAGGPQTSSFSSSSATTTRSLLVLATTSPLYFLYQQYHTNTSNDDDDGSATIIAPTPSVIAAVDKNDNTTTTTTTTIDEDDKSKKEFHNQQQQGQQQEQQQEQQQPYHRVLVVGSGLTGCLTALRIRQRWNEEETRKRMMDTQSHHKTKTLPPAQQQQQQHQQHQQHQQQLHLDVMERATYPAGRFGAVATLDGAIADLGAQVLSVVNPTDPRAKGGHGVTTENIALAHNIASWLTLHNILQPMDDNDDDTTTTNSSDSSDNVIDTNDNTPIISKDSHASACNTTFKLCPTEERMGWEGLWIHHIAPQGMVSVLQKLLQEANVHSIFGVKIDSIHIHDNSNHGDDNEPTEPTAAATTTTTITVKGRKKRRNGHTPITNHTVHNNNNNNKTPNDDTSCTNDDNDTTTTTNIQADYDCVVICVPAPDALAIHGVEQCLSEQGQAILRGVGYDSRVVEAHFFHPDMRPLLMKAFASSSSSSDGNNSTATTNNSNAKTLFLERNVDEEDLGLHLISFQDIKRQQQQYPRHLIDTTNDKQRNAGTKTNQHNSTITTTATTTATTPCAIVVHGSANSADIPDGSVDKVLSKLIRTSSSSNGNNTVMSENDIAQNRLHTKRINWRVSQMITPMEAVLADPHLLESPLQCLEGGSGGKQSSAAATKRIILAGDYMTQSSFLGCTASADAAAQTVVSALLGEKKMTDQKNINS